MSLHVLIVEDEASLREALVDLVTGAGYRTHAVADGPSALTAAESAEFDVVLLDIMLPGLDGLEVCARLRESHPDWGILMLTAKGAEEDKVTGLGRGADDYVTKPFGARELLARIDALGRRSHRNATDAPETLTVDECTIDLGRCTARRDGDSVTLTARETKILRWLHEHRARAVTRAELLEHVWEAPGDLQTRTVDMTIANLRAKIERDPTQPRIVTTVKGVGYAWGPA